MYRLVTVNFQLLNYIDFFKTVAVPICTCGFFNVFEESWKILS